MATRVGRWIPLVGLAFLSGCGGGSASSPVEPGAVAAAGSEGAAAGTAARSGSRSPALWPITATARWSSPLPTGGDPPLSGDPIGFACDVSLQAGEPVTVTLELTNGAARCFTASHCWRVVREFQPRLGRPFAGSVVRHDFAPTPPMGGTLTCTATTASGLGASSSTCFAMAGMSCPG